MSFLQFLLQDDGVSDAQLLSDVQKIEKDNEMCSG